MHAHALLAAREAFTLLANGFPHGAEARVRTIQEFAATARLLERNPTYIAERYDSSTVFELARHIESGEIEAKPEIAGFIAREKARLTRKFGKEMNQPYGWASPVFDRARVTTWMIVRAYGLSARPGLYPNASHHVHGVATGTAKVEQADPEGIYRSGPRPTGFLEPAWECIEQLNHVTQSLFSCVYSSFAGAEVVYWRELCNYLHSEIQLEIVRARTHVDPEWFKDTSAKVWKDSNWDFER